MLTVETCWSQVKPGNMPKNGHLKLLQHIRRQKALRQRWLRPIVYDDDLMEHTRRQGLVDRPDGVQSIEALQRKTARRARRCFDMSMLQWLCENMWKHVKRIHCRKNLVPWKAKAMFEDLHWRAKTETANVGWWKKSNSLHRLASPAQGNTTDILKASKSSPWLRGKSIEGYMILWYRDTCSFLF